MDPLRHLGDGRGVHGPTERCVPQGGDPAGLVGGGRLGRGCPRQVPNDGVAPPQRHGIDRGRVVEDPPDQIRAVESRVGEGRVEDGSGVGGGERSDSVK